MAVVNLGELVSTTLFDQSVATADNVSDNNALTRRLRRSGNKKPVSGGYEIRQPLSIHENDTFQWYQGYERLNVSPQPSVDVAVYEPKQASVGVTISGREMKMNRNDAELIDLLDERMREAERTMANKMSIGVYSDGTANGGNQIVGLATQVSKTPTTGKVGGIDRAAQTFWRNQALVGTPITVTNIEDKMTEMYTLTCRGSDKVDLIVSGNGYWRSFVKNLQGRQRYTRDEARNAREGFESVAFMSADVVLDGGRNGRCPDKQMYFLNTNYFFIRPYEGADMTPAPGGPRRPYDQDAEVHHVLWMGALTMNIAFLQGVLADA